MILINVNLLSSSSSAEKLLLAASENNLKQLITEPTRCINHSQTLLDVLVTSSPDLFSSAGCVEFTGSDHLMIYSECLQEVPVQSKVCTVRSFKKCDVEELSVELMDAPWQVMDTFNDVNDMWYYWKSLFLDVLDKHAPLLKVRRKMRGNDDWLDSGLRSLMRSRSYYRRKHRKTCAVEDWERFKALRNEVNRRVRVAKVEYYQSICKNISKQPRSTWSQLNAILGRSKRRPINQIISDGKTLTATSAIVSSFAKHFRSVASAPQPRVDLLARMESLSTEFTFNEVSEEAVREKLATLNDRKATGLDAISAKLLKMVAPAISSSLITLFNASLSQGCFPTEWKEANITPVPKSGVRHMMNNYRPISVLPVLAKVFESIVHQQLYSYLEKNKILKEEQTGFRPNRSTQDILLRTVDDWRGALDDGDVVATVMIDLSKAFDTINYGLMLKKLSEKLWAYCVRGVEFPWFKDYLTNRKQRVVLDGVSSEWSEVSMGVPQGSILGPLLFLIFVNDLPDAVEDCSINLYADDITIYSSDKDPTKLGDRVEKDLGRVAVWIDTNGLRMNVAKTQLMVLSRRGRRDAANSVRVKVGEMDLERKKCVKYLGVEINEDLSWKKHIEKMHRQCLAKLALIRRAGTYLPCNIRKLLYQAFILPHLDYCSVVWSSCGLTLSKRFERVQNFAMRIILRKPPLTSTLELRQSLGWISLRERRHCALLCQVHRCCSKQASPYLCSKFVLNSERQNYANTRGAVNLHLGRPKTNFFHNSFEFQGALHYNSLPSTIRGITSRSVFKKALLKYISSN